MPDLSTISDEELYRIAGLKPQAVSSVPDASSMSDQELMRIAFGNGAPDRPTLRTKPLETLSQSGKDYIGGLFQTLAHPIQTAKSVGSLLQGVGEQFIPGEQAHEGLAEAVGQFYKGRYGSVQDIGRTLDTDPVGFAGDASLLLTGGGAALRAAGTAGKISRLAEIGQTVGRVGRAVDPLAAVTRGLGTGAEAMTRGRTVRAPFAGRVNEAVIKAAQEFGVDLPASAQTASRLTPQLEAYAIKGLFGRQMLQKLERANERMMGVADRLIEQTGRSSDLTMAGQMAAKGADEFRREFQQVKKALYQKADVFNEGRQILVDPKRSLPFVQEILAQKEAAGRAIGISPDADRFRKIAESLAPTEKAVPTAILDASGQPVIKLVKQQVATASDIDAAVKELGEIIQNYNDPFVAGNKRKLLALHGLLNDDLDDAILKARPDLAEHVAAAKQYYKEGIGKLNSAYGEAIFSLRDQPDKIVPTLLTRRTSLDEIPRIYELIGQEAVPSVQSAFLEQFFLGAKNTEGTFTPQGLARQVQRYGEERLQAILTPTQYTTIKKLEALTQSTASLARITGGSQTGFLTRLAAEIGPMFVNPMLSLKLLGLDWAASRLVGSSFGQEVLSTGYELTGAGRAAGAGLRKAGKAGPALRAATVTRQAGGE